MHRNLLPLALLPVLACYPNTREHEDSVAPADTDTHQVPFDDYTTADGYAMVAISGGSFEMGSAEDGPIHTVTLTHAFWIGQTEVTQAQYVAATGTNPSHFSTCGDTCPVEGISWQTAAIYANALTVEDGLEPCYTATGTDLSASLGSDPYRCDGYRLPTEAEWEYAARGDESYPYSGSDAANEVAWTNENSGGTTHTVAGKGANGFGLYDMSGNVWEWTGDWYGSYASEDVVNPAGEAISSFRVLRGGDWFFATPFANVANRNYYDPGYASDYTFGLRLVRTAP
jgi:formylglycine-generating enzyme required for sulfatase activity